jgi:hypothetical protein
VPRILTALRHFVIAKAPTATSGPFQVTAVNAALLASAANDPTIVVQIWYPAAANLPATDLLSESATPVACSKVMDDRRLSNMTILIDDDVFPRPDQLQSHDPNERYASRLTDRDMRDEVRLANRPDGLGSRLLIPFHENLSDQVFQRRFSMAWLLTNPYRVKSIRDAYLLAFFDTYVRNMPSPLLTQSPSPFREVEVLKANEYWLKEAAKSTSQSFAESN